MRWPHPVSMITGVAGDACFTPAATCRPSTYGIPRSVITTAKNMQIKRDLIERVARALLEANAYILNSARRPRVVEVLTAQLGFKTPQEAAVAYEDLVKYYVLKKPYPNREGITNIIAEVAKSVPKAAGLKYEDVTDASIVEKLDRSGFIDGLYK